MAERPIEMPWGSYCHGNDITRAFIANYALVWLTGMWNILTDNIGAQANNSNTQTHIGFSFTLSNTAMTRDLNYVAAGTYSFYIETPPPTNTAPTANAGTRSDRRSLRRNGNS